MEIFQLNDLMRIQLLRTALAILIGFCADLFIGDPEHWQHPVRWIGALIAGLEKRLYPERGIDEQKFWHGFMLALLVPLCCAALSWWLLAVAYRASFWSGLVLESVMCWQLLAVKSMRDAARKVYRALKEEGLPAGRRAVAEIVGRDTAQLSAEGVIKAAVETVAENTSDGVTAPLFWLILGGPVTGWIYKAVNTMDSMIGYRNERYLFFGRAAARMDDVMNYIPARLAALLMLLASFPAGLDSAAALRIWKRDRRKHKSPNSAQTESVCAGALGIQLAGDAVYFGKTVNKPLIGDACRIPVPEDILRANRLLYGTAILSLLVTEAARVGWTLWSAGR